MKNTKEKIIEELKEALRWPEDLDVVSPDMDSRSSLERAADYVIEQTKRAREEVFQKVLWKKRYTSPPIWGVSNRQFPYVEVSDIEDIKKSLEKEGN
jgi:hypothetical protein